MVGTQLVDAESQLEKLATALRNGQVASVKVLDGQLTHIDRVLAQHHLTLTATALAHPRTDNVPVAARDLDRAAFYFERSVTLDGRKLTSEQAAMVTDARKMVKAIEESQKFPGEAGALVKLFEAALAASTEAAK